MRFLFFSLLLILGFSLSGQTTTTTKTTTVSGGESSTHNDNHNRHSRIHTKNGEVSSHSSTNRSKTSLTFTSDFKTTKQAAIKSLLLTRLEDLGVNKEMDSYRWEEGNTGAPYFTCKLTEGKLRINLDRTRAPKEFYNRINDLCDGLIGIIASHPGHTSQGYDPQLSNGPTGKKVSEEVEMQRALEQLEIAREKVERLGRKIDKKRKDN